MEGTSYLNELNGKPKEAESLWGILNSARKIEKVFGQVYVNFGEPVFLDNILQQNQADQIQLSIHDELPRPVINTVDQAAREILENINKAVVINPISLISTILLNAPQHALSQDDLLRQIEQYRELLKATHYDDRMIITQLSAPEIIEYALKLKQVEHYQQDNQTWIRVAESQRILLSYFSNNILHCLSLPALIALLVQDMPAITTAQLKQHVSRLYPFLKSELFLKWSATELPAQIDRILDSMQQLGWIEVSENIQLLELQSTHPMHSLATLARSSLNNFVLISQLLQEYAEPYQLDLKALEKMAKTVFKRLAESGNLNSGYYFDSATLKSFMGSLQQLGLLEMQGQQLQLKPQFDTEISDYLGWYAPELQQQIADKLLFSEKEIKQFKEYSKK